MKISKLLGRLAKVVLGWGSRMTSRMNCSSDLPGEALLLPSATAWNRACVGSPLIELLTLRTRHHCCNEIIRKTLPPLEWPLSTHTAGNDPETTLRKAPVSINLCANSNRRSSRKTVPPSHPPFKPPTLASKWED